MNIDDFDKYSKRAAETSKSVKEYKHSNDKSRNRALWKNNWK